MYNTILLNCSVWDFLCPWHWFLIDFNVIQNCIQKFVLHLIKTSHTEKPKTKNTKYLETYKYVDPKKMIDLLMKVRWFTQFKKLHKNLTCRRLLEILLWSVGFYSGILLNFHWCLKLCKVGLCGHLGIPLDKMQYFELVSDSAMANDNICPNG